MEIAVAVAAGLVAGLLAGFFGVGGGILFVPTFVLALGLGQLEAEATSLAAIIPTVAAGAWQQQRYGNVRWRDAGLLGLVAILGVEAGVRVADALSDEALRRLFALLLFGVAVQVALGALRADREPS
jgi:uncharacterized membrane protein YfcA